MLALLRGVGTARPRFDPGLAGGLRAWLEDAAWSVTSSRDDDQSPLVLGPRRLLGTPSGSWRLLARPDGSADEGQEATHLTRRLVHALFRHLVTTGSITAPLTEALDALAASGVDDVVDRVRALGPGSRAALEDVLAVHARHLQALVPRFAPSWLPRTDDRIAIPLAGGRVVLRGVFDLLVGTPCRSRGLAVRARVVDGRAVGTGATHAALPRPARDAAQRMPAVPPGHAAVRQRALRGRRRVRGAIGIHGLAHRGVAGRRCGGRWLSSLTDLLAAPLPPVDPVAWQAALDEATGCPRGTGSRAARRRAVPDHGPRGAGRLAGRRGPAGR